MKVLLFKIPKPENNVLVYQEVWQDIFYNQLIRIENVCKLLYKNKEVSIASISEESSFQNIANFNRKFKILIGITPTEYSIQFSSI